MIFRKLKVNMPRIRKPVRLYIGCGLLLLFAYTSSAILLKKSITGEIKPSFNAEIALLKTKLESVKPYLPLQGIIGYIDTHENVLTSVEAARTFILTQYILAPLIVVRDTDQDIVLGNFNRRNAGLRIAREYGLYCIKDFGSGLMLLQKKDGHK
jgi:hypothetical protein